MAKTIDELIEIANGKYICGDPYECPFDSYERKGPLDGTCLTPCPWKDIARYLAQLKKTKEALSEDQ